MSIRKSAPAKDVRADDVIARLRRMGSKRNVDGMARFRITSKEVLGVSVADVRAFAKTLERSHALASALWKSGIHEARMLAVFVEEPAKVTPAQMDRWASAFDNWAICDTTCFHLFDKLPHAFDRIDAWAEDGREFVKRAAFALIASIAQHVKDESVTSSLAACLPLIEQGALDDRNFVKKGVSWALRGVGRRGPKLHAESVALAQRLAARPERSARWVGKDALRELTSDAVMKQIARAAPQRTTRTRA